MADLRFALRLLLKSRAFALVAIVTLAIGIGVNTATFSMADGLLLRPIDVPDIDRVVSLFGTRPEFDQAAISPADFADIERRAAAFETVSAYEWWDAHMTGIGDPERVQGFRVTPSFFQVAGVNSLLGRVLLPGEEQEGRDDVAVLSHALWTRRFGADARVVGSNIQLNGRPYRIVGVMPKGFGIPRSVDLWVPLALSVKQRYRRDNFYLTGLARLKPGVSLDQANGELQRVAEALSREHPNSHRGRGMRAGLLRYTISGDLTAEYTRLMWAATLLLMLIACANVANLQFARASFRTRELAVRSALGASRWRLLRQFAMESVALGLAASAAGVAVAAWSLDAIKGNMPPEVERYLPGWSRIGLDTTVLCFLLVFSVVSAMLAGLLPALSASKVNLAAKLRDGGRGSGPGVARHRVRNALIVIEVALATVLLVGAGLILRGFRTIELPVSEETARSTLTLRLGLAPYRFQERGQIAAFLDESLTKVAALPAVRSAAMVSNLPFSDYSTSYPFVVAGAPPSPEGRLNIALRQVISPDYFRTLGFRMLRGREFNANDKEDSAPVAIVSERLARLYLKHTDPLGARLALGPDPSNARWIQVVGIAADVPHQFQGMRDRAAIYLPYWQAPERDFHIAVRADGDPMKLAAAVRGVLLEVDRNQPVWEVLRYDRRIHHTVLGLKYVAWSIGVSGVLALVLALVGIYSVMAYAVSERTHEIGVRVALGAPASEVVRMVVGQGMALAGLGLAIALPLSYVLARGLGSLLMGARPSDPVTYGAMVVLLLGTAFVACVIPARRAAMVDPVNALRQE